jgi:hypothetical protein
MTLRKNASEMMDDQAASKDWRDGRRRSLVAVQSSAITTSNGARKRKSMPAEMGSDAKIHPPPTKRASQLQATRNSGKGCDHPKNVSRTANAIANAEPNAPKIRAPLPNTPTAKKEIVAIAANTSEATARVRTNADGEGTFGVMHATLIADIGSAAQRACANYALETS